MGILFAIIVFLLPVSVVIYSIGYLRQPPPRGLSAKDSATLLAIKWYTAIVALSYLAIGVLITLGIFGAPSPDPRTNSTPDTFDLRAAAMAIMTGILTCLAFPLWYAGRATMNTILRKAKR